LVKEYLNDFKSKDFRQKLNDYFERYVANAMIRVGNKQTAETLINEEASILR
jgi:hypothetical protein